MLIDLNMDIQEETHHSLIFFAHTDLQRTVSFRTCSTQDIFMRHRLKVRLQQVSLILLTDLYQPLLLFESDILSAHQLLDFLQQPSFHSFPAQPITRRCSRSNFSVSRRQQILAAHLNPRILSRLFPCERLGLSLFFKCGRLALIQRNIRLIFLFFKDSKCFLNRALGPPQRFFIWIQPPIDSRSRPP